MPTQSQETQTNRDKYTEPNQENTQAQTGTEVREGQENSSIIHDKPDEKRPVNGPVDRDERAVNQEEFIEDRNTKKKSDDE